MKSAKPPPAACEIRENTSGDICVHLYGEIDISVEDNLAQWLHDAIAGHPGRPITVDLSELRFIDSSGVRSLIDAQRQAHAVGAPLNICGAHDAILTVLQVTGVYNTLTHDHTSHI